MNTLSNVNEISANNINELIRNLQIFGSNVVKTFDNSYTRFVDQSRLARHINNDNIKANINAKLDYSTANLQVKVTENLNGEYTSYPNFSVQFVNSPDMSYRYIIYREINRMVLKINVKQSGLANYIGTEADGYPGLNDTRTRIIMADLVTEALSRLIIEDEVYKYPVSVFDGTNESNLQMIFRKYELAVNSIEQKVYNILVFEDNVLLDVTTGSNV